jgi:hypothetical protein
LSWRTTGRPTIRGRSSFPYLDTVYTLAVPAGIILTCLGNYAIVGPLTAAVLPINGLAGLLMLRKESPNFRAVGLRMRRRPQDLFGLLLYGLMLQLFLSPVCVSGYLKELLHRRCSW